MGEEKPFEPVSRMRPGDEVLRRRREPRRRLRIAPNVPGLIRFIRVIVTQTPFVPMITLLTVLWLLFSAGIYFADRGASGTSINSYGDAVYCAVAAFSTSGIADMPVTSAGKAFCGVWMTLGSLIFFGAIVASVTVYFTRRKEGTVKQIISTVEYNLERLDDLSLEELEVLRETTDGLIDTQIERRKGGVDNRRGHSIA